LRPCPYTMPSRPSRDSTRPIAECGLGPWRHLAEQCAPALRSTRRRQQSRGALSSDGRRDSAAAFETGAFIRRESLGDIGHMPALRRILALSVLDDPTKSRGTVSNHADHCPINVNGQTVTGAKCFARRPALRGTHSTNWRWKRRVCSDHRTMAGASRDRPQTVCFTVLLLRYLDLRPIQDVC
jgi:hypothetical protein